MPKLSPDAPVVQPECEISGATFGRYVQIGQGTRLLNAEIGDYSYCDRFCDIANTTVGKFANIAAFVRIGPTDHTMHLAALHHFHYRTSYYWDDEPDDAAFFARRHARRTTLGHDTWIGHGAIIKPEVMIGHGAVVASGAVVTRDVAPYMIVAGVPATPLRDRLPARVADRLMALAWWDWGHDALHAAMDDFRRLPAEAFLEKYGG